MLSLYLHIPFCTQKCAYCSFTSFPVPPLSKGGAEGGGFIENYLDQLKKEIGHYGEKHRGEELKTLYLGGGTPSIIGTENILQLIEEVKKYFNLEFLEEFSIELNPYPEAEVLDLVKTLSNKLKDFPRVRFSFGIQSFDDKVLAESGRPYSFLQIMEFLRQLREIKQEHNVFNFDFIAFGRFNTTRSGNRQLRDQGKLDFFTSFVNSGFADSFSLYILELFEGSKRYYSKENLSSKVQGLSSSDDDIYEEFATLKDILLDAGYARYELSNFALPGKNSIHNMVYRTMQPYLGLGLASSSFISPHPVKGGVGGGFVRFTNTANLNDYLAGKRLDGSKTIEMTHEDYLIEKFFLNLRTNIGITDIDEFLPVLVPDYEKKIKSYAEQGFIKCAPLRKGLQSSLAGEGEPEASQGDLSNHSFRLTDSGMDVFNSIITELLAKI